MNHPLTSPYVRIADGLQWVGAACVRATRPLLLPFSVLLALYVGIGALLALSGLWPPLYPLLSVTSDPCLLSLLLAGAVLVSIHSAGLILLEVVAGVRTAQDWIVTVLAFVAFGTGVRVLWYALGQLLATPGIPG